LEFLKIDIETFSAADLPKTGVYRYAEDPSFEVLLFGVSVDDGPVTVYDLKCGDTIPEEILTALQDNSITKWAFNAQFERVCLSRYLWDMGRLKKGCFLNPRGWRCDMVWAGYMGFPMNLKGAGEALHLEEQKMDEGKNLITYFCKPYRPTSKNDYGKRNLPSHDPEKWELFKQYNKRDVEVEMSIAEKLSAHPVPEQVWEEYWMDQAINDRGILVDLPMVRSAIALDAKSKRNLKKEMREITSLANPQSVQQMQQWLRENGVELDSLGKKEIAAQLDGIEEPMRSVLLLRQELAMSAVKKYQAMATAACSDGRCRGMFQFYGANRSGRFAGRIVQLQNLFRNSLPDLNEARSLVKAGNYDALVALYDSIPQVLAECVRTAFIPAPGYKFIVSDFSAIEARVIAWLAGEEWRMEAFASGKDIYCASASQMFGVPVEKHGVNGHLRQKGKIAELALGYGGSVGALTAMGALDMGLTEDELQPLVNSWRLANPNITKLWWAVDRAVKTAVREKTTTHTHGLSFTYQGGMLYITLPSSRQLSYVLPRMGENRFGGESVTYMGTDFTKHWSRIESYGPKFVENIVQAISRDILCHAMEQLKEYRVVAHVHDECIVECPPSTTVQEISDRMATCPTWASGLILRADGYECPGYYMKD
jgi:DNA polymerase